MARTARVKILTAIEVKRYAEGPPTKKVIHDGGGLYLRKREGGCFWYLRMFDPHTAVEQWHRMFSSDPQGGYPHKTLSNARDEASRLWEIRRHGVDPRAEQKRVIEQQLRDDESSRRDQANLLTVRQLFERWAATDLAPHTRGDGKRIGRKDGGLYVRDQFERRVFPELGHVAIKDVRKADVMKILDAAKAEGKLRTANMLLADMKQMFRFAAEREVIEHSPIELVQKRKVGGKDTKRDRFLSGDELNQLLTQMPTANLNKRTELGLWVMLATGCRVGELMGAAWADAKPQHDALQTIIDAFNIKEKSGGAHLGFIDLESRIWHMPTTKNQRDHSIHLSEFAVTQIQALSQLRETRKDAEGKDGQIPWVFPNSAANSPVSIKSFGKQLSDRQRDPEERLENRTTKVDSLKLPGGRWTAHDLRRTASTIMSQLGISNDVINECMNHIKQGMSGVYIQDRRTAEQARAFDALGAKLNALVTGQQQPSNVVPLPHAA